MRGQKFPRVALNATSNCSGRLRINNHGIAQKFKSVEITRRSVHIWSLVLQKFYQNLSVTEPIRIHLLVFPPRQLGNQAIPLQNHLGQSDLQVAVAVAVAVAVLGVW